MQWKDAFGTLPSAHYIESAVKIHYNCRFLPLFLWDWQMVSIRNWVKLPMCVLGLLAIITSELFIILGMEGSYYMKSFMIPFPIPVFASWLRIILGSFIIQ